MKNLLTFVLLFVLFSCDKTEDSPLCCFPYGPPRYGLSIYIQPLSKDVDKIKAGHIKINSDAVYFFRMINGKKVKIESEGFKGIFKRNDGKEILMYGLDSEKKAIYDPIADKGLSTIYLQKLNNDIDTIQLDIRKKYDERRGNLLIMKKITINDKSPTIYKYCGRTFGTKREAGYCYYLN